VEPPKKRPQTTSPSPRLCCVAVEDPAADIAGDAHRRFIGEYLKLWPQPPMAHFIEGHTLNVECDGVQKTCKVLKTDYSLMQVCFPVSLQFSTCTCVFGILIAGLTVECACLLQHQHSGHKEWIYRGSMRLEHLVAMKKVLQRKEKEKKMAREGKFSFFFYVYGLRRSSIIGDLLIMRRH